jgi:hypothetical protein
MYWCVPPLSSIYVCALQACAIGGGLLHIVGLVLYFIFMKLTCCCVPPLCSVCLCALQACAIGGGLLRIAGLVLYFIFMKLVTCCCMPPLSAIYVLRFARLRDWWRPAARCRPRPLLHLHEAHMVYVPALPAALRYICSLTRA